LLLKTFLYIVLDFLELFLIAICAWNNTFSFKIFAFNIPKNIEDSVTFVWYDLKNLNFIKLVMVMIEKSIGKVHSYDFMHLFESFGLMNSWLFLFRSLLN